MTAQRILVLGATGGTGRHVAAQAVAMGIEVTALVRSPDKLASTERPLRAILYPAGLTNAPRTGTAHVGERLTLSGFPRVSRADVATVLLQQLNDPGFVGKGILVAN